MMVRIATIDTIFSRRYASSLPNIDSHVDFEQGWEIGPLHGVGMTMDGTFLSSCLIKYM